MYYGQYTLIILYQIHIAFADDETAASSSTLVVAAAAARCYSTRAAATPSPSNSFVLRSAYIIWIDSGRVRRLQNNS